MTDKELQICEKVIKVIKKGTCSINCGNPVYELGDYYVFGITLANITRYYIEHKSKGKIYTCSNEMSDYIDDRKLTCLKNQQNALLEEFLNYEI